MDLFEAIEKRHSYRGAFNGAPVPRADLEKIVQAGIQAPSGCNAQTTTFVVVDQPEVLRQIGDVMDRPVVRQAPALLVCVVEHRPVYHDLSFGVEDCAAAVENMLLAVTALGYAAVWIDGALRLNHVADKIAAILEIPKTLEVRVVLPVGIPQEICRQRERKPFADRVWFNRYGG
jgi:nitroreductase